MSRFLPVSLRLGQRPRAGQPRKRSSGSGLRSSRSGLRPSGGGLRWDAFVPGFSPSSALQPLPVPCRPRVCAWLVLGAVSRSRELGVLLLSWPVTDILSLVLILRIDRIAVTHCADENANPGKPSYPGPLDGKSEFTDPCVRALRTASLTCVFLPRAWDMLGPETHEQGLNQSATSVTDSRDHSTEAWMVPTCGSWTGPGRALRALELISPAL